MSRGFIPEELHGIKADIARSCVYASRIAKVVLPDSQDAAGGLTVAYGFSLAARRHLAYLPDIEEAAGALFSYDDLPHALRSLSVLPGEFLRAMNEKLLWVATVSNDLPIGFLLAAVIDGGLHIVEFDVHPAHGHRGVGTQLLDHAGS